MRRSIFLKIRAILCLLFGIYIGHRIAVRRYILPIMIREIENQKDLVSPLPINTTFESEDFIPGQQLDTRVSVFCLIVTKQVNHQTFIQKMKKHWIHKCSNYLIVSDVNDKEIPTSYGGFDEYNRLASGIAYILENRLDDKYDWFFFGDHSTFAIVENLRYFLLNKSWKEPFYYGGRNSLNHLVFASGIVASREALRLYRKTQVNLECWSKELHLQLGVAFERCMEHAGAKYDKESMLDFEDKPFFATCDLINRHEVWVHENKSKRSSFDLSDELASVTVDNEYNLAFLNYLIYGLRGFGIGKVSKITE